MASRGIRWTAFIVLDTLSVLLATYGILALSGIVGTEFSAVVALIVAGLFGLVALLILFSTMRRT